MNLLSKIGIAVTVGLALTACDKIKPPLPELQKPATAPDQAATQSKEHMALTQAAQKELDELRASIAELRAKAETANQETKAKLTEEAESIEAELREAQSKLAALKSATVESWNQLNTSFGQALQALKARVIDYKRKL